MSDDGTGSFPWSLVVSEIIGTTLLVLVGGDHINPTAWSKRPYCNGLVE